MANKKKNYTQETLDSLQLIAAEIQTLLKQEGYSVRGLAQRCDISVNSIRSVLEGKTANIATYDDVARALGSSLIEVVKNVKIPAPSVEPDANQDSVEQEAAEAPASFPGQTPMV